MTADFVGETLRLPPGVDDPPVFLNDIPQPAWLSPVASLRLRGKGNADGHLVVGGRTIWVRSGLSPSAIVASHPNRLGSAENIAAMVELAEQLGATAHVEVDPLLAGIVELPSQAWPTVRWPAAESQLVKAAAVRAQQGAGALRRRLAQIRGILFPVDYQYGRTVTVILPIPSLHVIEALEATGTRLGTSEFWEGGLSMTVGWWHTRHQIDSLAAAIGSIVAGADPSPVPPDHFDRIPDDLPLRRLDTIPFL